MNKHSLASKITFIFAISFVLVCVLFLLLYRFQADRTLDLMEQRQFQSMNYLLQLYKNKTQPKNIKSYFNFFNLKPVENLKLASFVLKKGEINFDRKTPIGRFASILYNDRYYLFMDTGLEKILLQSQNDKNMTDHLWIGFFLAIGVLITTYMSILKSFTPLRKLSTNIRKFASGDLEVEYKSDQKDEIAEVANEFDKAVKKIRHLILSRQLFLRAIMHELKTPIGKGRIVSEMINDDIQKNRLISIFERLDLLINEFSKIEQLVSQSYVLNVKPYPLHCFLDQSIDMLMLDISKTKKSVILDINNEDEIINADFDLMCLAMKNLIDNGLKYSIDNQVFITNITNGLRFSNRGKKLEYSIQHYYNAFIHDKNSKGLGLGLYIIKNIIEYHQYTLSYTYQENMHCFDIIWQSDTNNIIPKVTDEFA